MPPRGREGGLAASLIMKNHTRTQVLGLEVHLLALVGVTPPTTHFPWSCQPLITVPRFLWWPRMCVSRRLLCTQDIAALEFSRDIGWSKSAATEVLAVGPGLCCDPAPIRLCMHSANGSEGPALKVSAEGMLSDGYLHWSLLLHPGWEEVNCAWTWLLFGVFFILLWTNPLFLSSSKKMVPTIYTEYKFKVLFCILEISSIIEWNERLYPLKKKKRIFKQGYDLGWWCRRMMPFGYNELSIHRWLV